MLNGLVERGSYHLPATGSSPCLMRYRNEASFAATRMYSRPWGSGREAQPAGYATAKACSMIPGCLLRSRCLHVIGERQRQEAAHCSALHVYVLMHQPSTCTLT